MDKKASVTALMSAFVRAYHFESGGETVFADPVARKLFSDEEYRQMRDYIAGGIDFFAPGKKGRFKSEEEILRWVINTQLAPTPLARARYCEDCLKTAVATGTAQYVILGAGLDTFAWREPLLMKKLGVFEVDHPLTQADKRERIDRAGLGTPEGLHFVPVDLSCDDLEARLLQSGFDETKITFFNWLGVSYYLTEEQISKLLQSIARFAADGSTILFDYGDDRLFTAEEKRVQNMLAMAAAGGEPMRFCADEWSLTLLLEKSHFLIYEHLDANEVESRFYYGRRDGLSAFEHICYAQAVLKNSQFAGTKERIMQTALRLFARSGYDAVSVKDITDRLLITKAALYKHYGSKREILDCILERMRQADKERAEKYEMPCGTVSEMESAYACTEADRIKSYTEAQFRYWTEESFSSDFRRMLTLEQFRDDEMAGLYRQYLAGGPLAYMEDLFRETGYGEAAGKLALDFYAPVFMLYSLYDDARDKAEAASKLHQHIESFFAAHSLTKNKKRVNENEISAK